MNVAVPPIRVGAAVVGSGDGTPPSRSVIEALERAGVDSLWAPGHVAIGRPVPEAMTGLARLAALTERCTVGTAVLLLPLYHPVIVAKQLAELDRSTGGRIAAGIGVGGEYELEFRACQVPLAERGPRTDEAMLLLRELWTGSPIDRTGPYWNFAGLTIEPGPHRPGGPPLVVAGRKAPAMRRAAVLGDGWMPFLYSPRRYAESVGRIREEARRVGRDLARFDWMCFIYVSVHDDPAVARQRAREFIGAGQAGDPERFGPILDRIAAAGTTDDVHRRLQEFVDAGVRHLVLMTCNPDDQVETLARLLDEVIPKLEAQRAIRSC